MADPRRFDRARFTSSLGTAFVGRALEVRQATESTNDDAWIALAAGGPDGLAVVADEQTAGRGRAGRAWSHSPGLALALSLGLRVSPQHPVTATIPLAAGLAVADAIAGFGVDPRLKWPNDVLLGGRKLAGVLCEMRRTTAGDAVVVGIGINVGQQPGDFSFSLRESAVSLAQAGVETSIEHVAASVCGALETRLLQLRTGDRAGVLGAWSSRAAFWGEPVTVRAAGGGDVTGTALRIDLSGGLVLRLGDGGEWTAVEGDLMTGGTR